MVAGKCVLAGDHLVEDRADRENVRARVEGFSARLLGRHIMGGVPTVEPSWVSFVMPVPVARPKSANIARPEVSKRMLSGLMSRWDDARAVRFVEAVAYLQGDIQRPDQTDIILALDQIAEAIATDVTPSR